MAYGIDTLRAMPKVVAGVAGDTYRGVGNAYSNTQFGGSRVGQVVGNVANYPIAHPVMTAAGLGSLYLGGRAVGSLLPDETKAAVAQNPVGSALTGLDPNDPYLKEQASIDAVQRENQRVHDQLIQDYKDRAKYDTDLAFANAQRRAPLEYGWGSAVKFRDTYAKQLGDEVGQYLEAMRATNDSVRNILTGSNLQFK